MSKVLVLRCCRENMTSWRNFVWPAKGLVACADWNPVKACGHGLHGWLWGEGNTGVASLPVTDKYLRWLVVEVEGSEIVDLGGKVKFPKGHVVFCGTAVRAAGYILKNGGKGRAVIYGRVTAGDYGTAVTGDYGRSVAGESGSAVSGYCGRSVVGDSGQAYADDYGRAEAGDSGVADAGTRGTAVAGASGTARAGNYGVAISGRFGRSFAGPDGAAMAGEYGVAEVGFGGRAAAGDGGRIVFRDSDGNASVFRVNSSPVVPGVFYSYDWVGLRLFRASNQGKAVK